MYKEMARKTPVFSKKYICRQKEKMTLLETNFLKIEELLKKPS